MMMKFDMCGQTLPTVELLGHHIYPPDLLHIKRLPKITEFMKAAVESTLSEDNLMDFLQLLSEYLNFNENKANFNVKRLKKSSIEELFSVAANYILFINCVSKKSEFAIPNIRDTEEKDNSYSYEITTYWEKLVSRYSGISIPDVLRLNFIDFLILRRDAFIYYMSQSEKGKELLEQAYCFEQSEPDRDALRREIGNGGLTIG